MKILYTVLFVFLFQLSASTQSFVWHSPLQAGYAVIEGQGWPDGVADRFDRLPAGAEGIVPKAVWGLSKQAAGLMIRFKSNADEIRVRYAVGGAQAMAHMPATGVSGVDLYVVDYDGRQQWCGGTYSFKDTIAYTYVRLAGKVREYRLYLPLYNSVKWLEIGASDSAVFSWQPVRTAKPIVVYGTSIAQGACASRPGMAWPAILGRALDVPVINLGFSGSGKMEPEVVAQVNALDARLYILDCLPNMIGFTEADLKGRIMAAVDSIRGRHQAPILLVEHAGYTDGAVNRLREEQYVRVNKWMQEVYATLKARHVDDIYYLSKEKIGLGMDMTVDGTHPTDWGMEAYAKAYEACIRSLWKRR